MCDRLAGEALPLRVQEARHTTPSVTGFPAPRVQPAIPKRWALGLTGVAPRTSPHAGQIGHPYMTGPSWAGLAALETAAARPPALE